MPVPLGRNKNVGHCGSTEDGAFLNNQPVRAKTFALPRARFSEQYRLNFAETVRLIYNILFLIFFMLSSPYYFWRMWRRGDWRSGFGERFAQYDTKLKQALTNRHSLWLHAVSVGEVGICTALKPSCLIICMRSRAISGFFQAGRMATGSRRCE